MKPIARVLVVGFVPVFGCASLQPQITPPIEPSPTLGAMTERTEFEREGRDTSLDDSDTKKRNVTPALMWTGVALASVGAVGTLGFGIAGRVTQGKIDDGFEDGMTRKELDDLESRGETWNTVAITSASIGLAGAVLAMVVYGVDYTRCGPLAPKKRRCADRRR
jgi:hypothetical protein